MQVKSFNKLTPMGSYPKDDVTFLLKDLSNVMEEQETEDREKAIQSGIHYSEMLPVEYQPTSQYMELFWKSLNEYSQKLAVSVGVVAEEIFEKKGDRIVLVSLARAGTPIGILIKRYLAYVHGLDLPHYSVSIIRGKGIDENAIAYIARHHGTEGIQFVDGWTGKGVITTELKGACRKLQNDFGFSIDDSLAVLADPGYCAEIFGTREDFLIPSACLNSTVSGLVSRTVHNAAYIKDHDFHGAKYYHHLEKEDVSNEFIRVITDEFQYVKDEVKSQLEELRKSGSELSWSGLEAIKEIQERFQIQDINHIKPGVGETTRVLLRRVPWKILVRDRDDERLKHILLLAEERDVPVEEYKNMAYACCGLIKMVGDQK
ncbi:cysteine protease StiP family protein [Bacillus sp. MUM 13]|uniref:cysteine protease StiP family protein n=1 Tax=Bacillus sp. MUM 13 TaxID=1678001 RepID=UPI0008F58613|nr:cysteine protease StiP family protein [Bacillus sp. MUM 13]OIK08396.1 hypothetical protein BIV59_20230 [Bacillus sp. MUM 13]